MRFRLAIPTLLCLAASAGAQVSIQPDSGGYRIKTDAYEACVSPQGGLASLQVGQTEFVETHASIAFGSYFYQDGPIPATSLSKLSDDALSAGSASGEAQYTFTNGSVALRAKNLTDKQIVFFVIVRHSAFGVRGPDGTYLHAPTVQSWSQATWFCEKSKLTVSGFTKLWGPWESGSQVIELDIPPKLSGTITITPGKADAGELAQVAKLAAADQLTEGDLNVYSPKDYQVFQRASLYSGQILVSGKVKLPADRVEARITGDSLKGQLPGKWQRVDLTPVTGEFRGTVATVPGGWYRVEIRASKSGAPVKACSVEHVGLGEVFAGAGQSNSTNCGQFQTKQTSGMVSTFSGKDWRLADDPQPGAHDNTQGGSFWPAFGDAMYARYKVPIGVAVTGHGGTSVTQWQPGGELFNWTLGRICQLGVGGFRGVLWHQGEADVAMDPDYYATLLTNTIVASKLYAGWEFPWFVAQVSYIDPAHPSFDTTRKAQKALWDKGIALQGPDSDTLTGDSRDHEGKGIHLSPKGLKAHGEMWAECVAAYLDKVLGIAK
jgi:hypothetical protein